MQYTCLEHMPRVPCTPTGGGAEPRTLTLSDRIRVRGMSKSGGSDTFGVGLASVCRCPVNVLQYSVGGFPVGEAP